jgi:hypothetical protein
MQCRLHSKQHPRACAYFSSTHDSPASAGVEVVALGKTEKGVVEVVAGNDVVVLCVHVALM